MPARCFFPGTKHGVSMSKPQYPKILSAIQVYKNGPLFLFTRGLLSYFFDVYYFFLIYGLMNILIVELLLALPYFSPSISNTLEDYVSGAGNSC